MARKCEHCGRSARSNPDGMIKLSELAAEYGLAHSTINCWITQGRFVLGAGDIRPSVPGATAYLGPQTQAKIRAVMAAIVAGVNTVTAFAMVFDSDADAIAARIKAAIETCRTPSNLSAKPLLSLEAQAELSCQ